MRHLSALLALGLLAAPLRAEDAKSSVLSWFKNLKNSLERSSVEGKYRRMRTATAVAAVRGSGQQAADATQPYWKGGWSEKREKERAKEREELAAAAGLLVDGKTSEARAAFEAFQKAHPKSSFSGEAAEALAKLDEMEGKPAARAAEAPADAAPKAAEAKPAEEPKPAEPAKPEAAPKAEEPAKAEAPKAEAAPEPAKPAEAPAAEAPKAP